MKKILFFTQFVFFSIILLGQQRIDISGVVLDEQAGTTLPYAVIRINGAVAYTDSTGTFDLNIPVSSRYHIFVEYLGYQTSEQWIREIPGNRLAIFLTESPIVIEEILVTDQAGKALQTEVLSDEVKRSTQARDVGDWLRDVPGFGIIRRGGYALDPVFRSFKYEQLNLIYDGGVQVTHACPNRMDPATTHVTPEEIEKIELIKGPFSVRYGPVMGAVVNIVTESPKPTGGRIGGKLEGGYEFNGEGKLSRLSLFGGDRGYDFYVNGGWKDFRNYNSGAGEEIPSAFTTYDYTVKAGFNPGEDQRIQLGWRQSFGRDILHAGLPMDTDIDNSSIFNLDFSQKRAGGKLYGISAKAYGSWVHHVMSNNRRPNFMMMEAVSTVDAQTYGGKTELNWLLNPKVILYTGLDARFVGRSGERIRTVKRNMMTGEVLPMPVVFVDNVWQDGRIFNGGLFGEGRFLPDDRWTLITGLRVDYNLARAADPAPDFEMLYGTADPDPQVNVSVNASANFRPAPGWDLQLALGRGVRSANMIERYINHFTVGRDPHEYVGDPHLKAEANHQVEFSAGRDLERLSLKGSLFYSAFSNYITAAVDSSLRRKYNPMMEPRFAKRFQNIDRADQLGFEAGIQYRFLKHLTAYGSVAYTRARNLDWDESLPEIPPLEGVVGLKYERPKWWTDLRGRFVDQQDQIAPSFGETTTSGFSVFDFRAGWKPVRDLSLGLAVLNIFDRNYYEHLNRSFVNMPETGELYEPGRNLSLYLSFGF